MITKDDIKEVFRREGRTITPKDLQEMFGAVEVITFEHFSKTMMEVIQQEHSETMDTS
jgi:Ca2+-binding EF-hand superfamily protein